jgi:5-methylcytosine-specific restriction endonuclease McrA
MPWPKGKPFTPEMVAKRAASLRASGARRKQPNADGTWSCPTCKLDLPATAFYAKKRSPSGISSQCRACHAAGSLRTRDPVKARESSRRSEANRRARMAGARGRVTSADYVLLEQLLGCACLKCGTAQRPTWDHIVPLAKGGDHHPLNLQPLCRACNEKKQARTADHRSDKQRDAVAKVWVVEFKRLEAAARPREAK